MTAMTPAMAPARAGVLYTPEILAAATGLAGFPLADDLPLRADARSRSCGSSIAMGLALDSQGCVARIGLRPHACAVGQAAAFVFARAAPGRSRADLAAARDGIAAWLDGSDDAPDWPGIALLEPVRGYPARHAAVLLAWDAALAAMP
ncbi:iron-sulfur cluster assembly scaffold protein [Novosphingobium lentum]|uniref:iron-sulfur cluster assembly scaffold protein n=1 Tax=Novosphingobium lentum TaxID=145287 RepID=UPI000A8862C3|nr:iron-sulfur cluster assembly scaffold protein [Novosphingobium lentum]